MRFSIGSNFVCMVVVFLAVAVSSPNTTYAVGCACFDDPAAFTAFNEADGKLLKGSRTPTKMKKTPSSTVGSHSASFSRTERSRDFFMTNPPLALEPVVDGRDEATKMMRTGGTRDEAVD